MKASILLPAVFLTFTASAVSAQSASPNDAQIAAICRYYRARLATRNVGDFVGTGVELINPWEAPAE